MQVGEGEFDHLDADQCELERQSVISQFAGSLLRPTSCTRQADVAARALFVGRPDLNLTDRIKLWQFVVFHKP
jgi:hypothetical protein